MPIQPGLALQVKGLELPDPLAMQAQATQIQNALQQQRMGEMQIQNAMREQRRTQELESLMAGFSPEAPAPEVARKLQERGFFQQAGQTLQQAALRDKTAREAQAARFTEIKTKAELAGRIFSGVSDQGSYTAARTRAIQQNLATADEIPEAYDKAAVDRIVRNAIDVPKALELQIKERATAATESQAATASAKLPFERQRAEAAALQAATAAGKAKFERENPGFTIQETDKGLFKVNKRTGATEPLMQDDEQLKAPERRPLVQVTPGESAFNQAIGTGLGRQVVKDLEAAQTAPSIANRANSVLTAIDQNKAFVGPASEFKLQLARALNVTGKGPSEQIAATETLIADLKQAVIEAIKASNLGTGNGFTNKDLDFLVKAKAADIANDPKTLAEFARRAYLTAEEAAKLGNKIVETNEQVKRQYQGRSFEVPPMFQSSGKSGVRRGTAAAAEDGGRREIAPGVFVTERP
jgi:hypothetical protein